MTGQIISLPAISFATLGTGDLKRQRFQGAAIPNQSFHGNFLECYFDEVELNSIDFSRCDWKDCRARDSLFVECDLSHASMMTNSFENCRFTRCRFDDTGISDCVFTDCEFTDCDLSHIVAKASHFASTTFANCTTSNRIIESSLLLNTAWQGMELQVDLITGNFGLKESDLTDCTFVQLDAHRNRVPIFPKDLTDYADDWSVLERFRIRYFQTGLIDGDAVALEDALNPRNWSGDAPIRASLGALLSSFSQFLISQYSLGETPFYPLLKFHSNNFALLDWLSQYDEHQALYQTVAGVHLALTREVDSFLRLVEEVSNVQGANPVVHVAAEGPVDTLYFANVLAELGFSEAHVVSVRPRNSPVDLGLLFSDHTWLLGFVGLLLACRTKVEVSKDWAGAKATKQSRAALRGGESKKEIVSIQTGFLQKKSSEEFSFNFRTMLPRSLLLELHLGINVALFKRAKQAFLFFLSNTGSQHPETPQ